MARYMRLEVINMLLEIGVVPLFYHSELETGVELVNACVRGGARVIEFTNRGEMAYPVFVELVRHFAKADPSVILGVGSIIDAPTAALYLAAGANFIVGPSLNPDISRLCNRRKILYIPGCTTTNEISAAEELGAEICKLFPGETLGPGYVKAIMAPCPWYRLLITGGVDTTQASISDWIVAGAAAVGLGSKLITVKAIKDKDYGTITTKVEQCISWVKSARK